MTPNPAILISINTSWNIYHFRDGLMSALKAAGYRLYAAAPEDAYSARLKKRVDAYFPLPMDNAGTSPLRDILLLRRYYRLLKEHRPALMLTYTIKPNIYGALAAQFLGIPVIANVSGLGTAFIRKTWLTHIVMRLYRFAFRRVACVFFQNPEDRELFIAHRLVAPEKALLLPGSGVNIGFFSPSADSRPANAPLSFVLIARLLWDKGIAEYIIAARQVKALHPNVKFRLVGPLGVQNQTAITSMQVRSWVDEGIIEYLGETDDVRAVLAGHDCVVLPSYREGMSRVLLEASAMGKPMIATDVPGCRHIVTHELNGLLCKPHDGEDLARAMLAFIALPPEQRTAMGAASRERAVREFDETLVLNAYLKKIAEVL